MRTIPNLPWPIRLVALVLAAGLSLYVLEIYVSGTRLVALVGTLSRSAALPSRAAPPSKGEPGVVSVNILPEPKPAR
jgi:hypothetical protein